MAGEAVPWLPFGSQASLTIRGKEGMAASVGSEPLPSAGGWLGAGQPMLGCSKWRLTH